MTNYNVKQKDLYGEKTITEEHVQNNVSEWGCHYLAKTISLYCVRSKTAPHSAVVTVQRELSYCNDNSLCLTPSKENGSYETPATLHRAVYTMQETGRFAQRKDSPPTAAGKMGCQILRCCGAAPVPKDRTAAWPGLFAVPGG